MNRQELNTWLMRTALEKILFSRCICKDKIDDLTELSCCPACLAKDTLSVIDGHAPHVNKTVEHEEYMGV